MKTRLSTLTALVAGLTATLLSNGCGHSSPPPRTTRVITPAPVVVQVPTPPPTVVTTTTTAPAPAPAPTPEPEAVATPPAQTPAPEPTPVAQMETSPLSPANAVEITIEETLNEAAAQILKMYESGVSEEVLNSYADASAAPFDLTPEQIIFFTDIGLSDATLTKMIEHDQALGMATPDLNAALEAHVAEPPPTTTTSQPDPPVYAQNPPQSQAVATPAPTTQTVIVQQRPAVTTQVFYDSLSPYGTWIYMDDFGWTWQPTVATVNVNWRPYYDRGRWVYTDAGWYWHSSYSWGWAPFHYGRWARPAGYGWVWIPGTTWAPSWVSWRYTDAYCGWAPLPPYADYSVGVGFTYRGSRVGVGFGFGLGYSHYSFVSRRHFGRRGHHANRDRIDQGQAEQVYNDSTVINNYIVGDNNTIINEGIGRERINRGTDEEVRRVSLADVGDSRRAADSRRDGNLGESIPVYRPKVANNEASPTERQLARQETRATRKKIEDRSGRNLKQEPTRRMTRGASSGTTLAASTASTSGRIAPNLTSRSSTSNAVQKLGSSSNRGTPTTARTRTSQRPTRPASTVAASSKGGSRKLTGITKSSVVSSNPRSPARTEINAQRAAASRSRLETRASRNNAVSSRTRPSQRPQRTTIAANRKSSQTALAKRSTPQPSSNRIAPSYSAPRNRATTATTRNTTPRGRVQSSQRNSTPSATRNRVNTQPTRPNTPSAPTYQARSRNEVSTQRSTPSNNNALRRMAQQPSQRQTTIHSRTVPSAPNFRSRTVPSAPNYRPRTVPSAPQRTTPQYQAPQRRTPAPSPSRQTMSPSSRRQTAPAPTRSYTRPQIPQQSQTYRAPSRTPSYSAPSRSQSYSAPSRSRSSYSSPSRSVPSRSSAPSTSRSAPQRSRGTPSR